jgi:hypothetical protein
LLHEEVVPAAHLLKTWFAHTFTISCRKEDSFTSDKHAHTRDGTLCLQTLIDGRVCHFQTMIRQRKGVRQNLMPLILDILFIV